MIQTLFSNPWQHWLVRHPRLEWAIAHPFISVAVLFVLGSLLVFIFQTLARSLAQLNVAVWTTFFTFPLKFVRFLSSGLKFKASQNSFPPAEQSPQLTFSDRPLELTEILQQLEALNREQNQLLQQLVTLLSLKT